MGFGGGGGATEATDFAAVAGTLVTIVDEVLVDLSAFVGFAFADARGLDDGAPLETVEGTTASAATVAEAGLA